MGKRVWTKLDGDIGSAAFHMEYSESLSIGYRASFNEDDKLVMTVIHMRTIPETVQVILDEKAWLRSVFPKEAKTRKTKSKKKSKYVTKT